MDIVTKKSAISAKNYNCTVCHICCSKKNDWDRHILTRKHIGKQTSNEIHPTKIFSCEKCSKIYKSRKGLWGHNKTCVITNKNNNEVNNIIIDIVSIDNNEPILDKNEKLIEILIKENSEMKNIVLEIVKSNSELQKQLVDSCKNSNIIINSNNNSHNKTFNLQFFLNEQCKDAMNISDFINTFELQLEDLESVGELGYVEGVTKIIVDKLNSMDIYKRPMHCSDAKREILYIKDNNKWEKEERTNPKLRKAIKSVSFKNMKLAVVWSDTYPESKDGESQLNDTYMRLIKQCTGGNGEIGDSEDKIIRRIAKEILIDKMQFTK